MIKNAICTKQVEINKLRFYTGQNREGGSQDDCADHTLLHGEELETFDKD